MTISMLHVVNQLQHKEVRMSGCNPITQHISAMCAYASMEADAKATWLTVCMTLIGCAWDAGGRRCN